MARAPVVALIATLDTKGPEARFLKERLAQLGQEALVIDAGVLGEPSVPADISRERVAAAGGGGLEQLRASADRGHAVAVMGRGAAVILAELHRSGCLAGVLGLGGSAGTSVAATALRDLPTGLPKLIVSTMASGNTRPYVGVKDVTMMHSVVDLAGLNRVSREILENAAAALAGMTSGYLARQINLPKENARPLVAATMFGVTTPCVERARCELEARGYEVLVFHATGAGGRAMESLVGEGHIAGVLDVTTTEWADELVGGILSAGPERLEAMGHRGVPHVVAPGALDMVNFGPRRAVPERFAGRLFYQHNPQITLMRTTPDENRQLGRVIADKLNAARSPTEVFLPLEGFSALDREGACFFDPEADRAFRESLRGVLAPGIPVHELPYHLNDEAFAVAMAGRLDALIQATLKETERDHGTEPRTHP